MLLLFGLLHWWLVSVLPTGKEGEGSGGGGPVFSGAAKQRALVAAFQQLAPPQLSPTSQVALVGGAYHSNSKPNVTTTPCSRRLGAVRQSDLLAVEVLWTPEEEDDYFTQRDLAMDYPLLNTL